MHIGVLGATGYSGSHVCIELLSRGHDVVGFSRNPEKLGSHKNYQPSKVDVVASSIAQLEETFKGLDVLVNGFNPPPGPNSYKTFVETTRKVLLAAKAAKIGYFIMIGGTGSLEVPGQPFVTCADSREFWLSYRRAVADSEAATQHSQDRMGPGAMSDGMRAYRNARLALRKGQGMDDSNKKVIDEVELGIKNGENWIPDLPLAARATFPMFEGNTSFKWSFVSPSGRFRPGPRTGKYEVYFDELPLAKQAKEESVDGNPFDGKLLGVSAADLAVAIVDEAEKGEKFGRHWSAVSEWEDDSPMPTTITI